MNLPTTAPTENKDALHLPGLRKIAYFDSAQVPAEATIIANTGQPVTIAALPVVVNTYGTPELTESLQADGTHKTTLKFSTLDTIPPHGIAFIAEKQDHSRHLIGTSSLPPIAIEYERTTGTQTSPAGYEYTITWSRPPIPVTVWLPEDITAPII